MKNFPNPQEGYWGISSEQQGSLTSLPSFPVAPCHLHWPIHQTSELHAHSLSPLLIFFGRARVCGVLELL